MPSSQFVDSSFLLWQGKGDLPPMNTRIWIFQVEHEQFISEDLRLGYIYDSRSSWICVPQPKPSLDMRILELFSGSFGGWKAGMHFIHYKTDFCIQTVSIDHDHQTCLNFALNHATNFLKTTNHLTDGLFVHSTDSWVIAPDVLDPALLKALSLWAPQAATVSAPCPPWSRAGRGGGLLKPDGMLLLKTILHLRWLNVPFVGLKNVSSITSHEHFDMVKQTFHFAGYKMLWQRTADLQDLTRVARNRWLALWGKAEHDLPPMPSQFWERIDRSLMPNPLMHFPDATLQMLRLPADVLRIVVDPHFLKINGKAFAVGMSDVDVLNVRTFRGGTVPTFLARYGTQHLLDEHLLRDQGLHAYFACADEVPEKCRYWHPAEEALLHGVVTPIYLPEDNFGAWFGLGKMIAVQHSLLVLANMLTRCADVTIDLKLLLSEFRNEQFLAKHTHLHSLAKGYMVCPKGILFTRDFENSASAIHDFLESNAPVFWSPKVGIQPIEKAHWTFNKATASQVSDVSEIQSADELPDCPPTFQASIQFETHASKFWFSGDLPGEAIRAVWDHKFDTGFFDGNNVIVLELRPTEQVKNQTFGFETSVAVLLDSELTLMLSRPVAVADQPHLVNLASNLYNQFGWLEASKQLTGDTLLLDRPLDTPHISFEVVDLLSTFSQIRTHWDWNSSNDHFECKVQGDETAKRIWGRFWYEVLTTTDQEMLGRKAVLDVDTSDVCFTSGVQGVCPIRPFKTALLAQATKAILQQVAGHVLSTDTMEMVCIKWGADEVWKGLLPVSLSLQVLHKAIDIAFSVTFNGWPMRFLNKGKQVMPERLLQEFNVTPQHEAITFHLIAALQRGGAKTQQKQLQQTSIAAAPWPRLLAGLDHTNHWHHDEPRSSPQNCTARIHAYGYRKSWSHS